MSAQNQLIDLVSDENFRSVTFRIVCGDCLKPCTVEKIQVWIGSARFVTCECACRFVVLELPHRVSARDRVATMISTQLAPVTPSVLQRVRDESETNALSLMDAVRALDRVLAQPAMREVETPAGPCCLYAAGAEGAAPCASCRG